MKIQSITTGFDQQVGLILFGLGDDNKIYRWNAVIGGWQPNWLEQPALKIEQTRAAARRAVAKGIKAKAPAKAPVKPPAKKRR